MEDFDFDEMMDTLSDRLENIVKDTLEDQMEDMMDTLSDRLENVVEDILEDQVEDVVRGAVLDVLDEALHASLSRFEFVLADGTVIRPRQHMKLLSPDKSKILLCYGGLRVDGCSLIVQTGATCWERITHYPSKEEAVEALMKVKKAMDDDLAVFEMP